MNNNAGEKLKIIRTRSGLTQDQIASYLDVDRSYIIEMENGRRNISTDALTKLSSLYRCSEEDILKCDPCTIPLIIDFTKQDLDGKTLKAVAAINKLALNLRMMDGLLAESKMIRE